MRVAVSRTVIKRVTFRNHTCMCDLYNSCSVTLSFLIVKWLLIDTSRIYSVGIKNTSFQ